MQPESHRTGDTLQLSAPLPFRGEGRVTIDFRRVSDLSPFTNGEAESVAQLCVRWQFANALQSRMIDRNG